MNPEMHAVQFEVVVQVAQLDKQAVQVGRVFAKNPVDKHAVQAGVVPVTVAHPVGKAKHTAFIN